MHDVKATVKGRGPCESIVEIEQLNYISDETGYIPRVLISCGVTEPHKRHMRTIGTTTGIVQIEWDE